MAIGNFQQPVSVPDINVVNMQFARLHHSVYTDDPVVPGVPEILHIRYGKWRRKNVTFLTHLQYTT